MSPLWVLEAGAQPQPDNSVRFTLWAPHAESPRVRLCSGAAQGDHAMTPVPGERGVHSATVANAAPGDDYLFVLDDGRALPDPVSRWQPHGVHGASRVLDPAFEWTDNMWRGTPMDEIIAYELHVGTFTPEGTFAAIVPRLPELKALGVNTIELMPVAQFPGDRNWGYDGVALYAVQDSYGGPVELKKLIDAAHELRIGVILDVVYNHVGPEGNNLEAFGPYFTDRYKTPSGAALNYDGPDSDDVRRFVVDNASYWVAEYHVDGLRLDAVHGIFDLSARHLLEEIAAAVHDRAKEMQKSIVVIAESDLNDPRLVNSVEYNGFGLDAQWSDDFHHAVHSVLTGETNGYYCDFGSVSHIGDALREPFVYDGRYSAYRRRSHGRPSVGLSSDRFVVSIQNHDQVGNRVRGDRLATLLTPDKLRLAAALLLLSPYIPLLFMGEEYGETNPFQYFVSHGDEQLAAAATFQRSKLDWSKRSEGAHAELLALYRDLLAFRREDWLMRPDRARITVNDGEPGWITILRECVDEWSDTYPTILCIFNCSAAALEVPIPDSTGCAWTMRLGTDAAGYGGNAQLATDIAADDETDGPRRLLANAPRTIHMPPWTAAVYLARPGASAHVGR